MHNKAGLVFAWHSSKGQISVIIISPDRRNPNAYIGRKSEDMERSKRKEKRKNILNNRLGKFFEKKEN